MTKLDVIIAAYNAESTIAKAVRSALTVEGASVLVVDDGSTDRTADFARCSGATVVSQSNAGAAAARRKGLERTSSPFVTYLDADDELVADGVLHSVRMLEAEAQAVAAAGRVLGRVGVRERILPRRYASVTLESLLRVGHGPWPPAAAVLRRAALIEASRLSINELNPRYAEDYEMAIRLSAVGRILMHDQVSCTYQMYGGKSSAAGAESLLDKEQIRVHYAHHFGLPVARMDARDVVTAADIRRARALIGARNIAGMGLAFCALVRNPGFVFRKMRQRFS